MKNDTTVRDPSNLGRARTTSCLGQSYGSHSRLIPIIFEVMAIMTTADDVFIYDYHGDVYHDNLHT
jgi:hypothetical protein